MLLVESDKFLLSFSITACSKNTIRKSVESIVVLNFLMAMKFDIFNHKLIFPQLNLIELSISSKYEV